MDASDEVCFRLWQLLASKRASHVASGRPTTRRQRRHGAGGVPSGINLHERSAVPILLRQRGDGAAVVVSYEGL